MGTLVVMRYPTRLFADAADHTYVECAGGGKAWGCWGGKTGGTALGGLLVFLNERARWKREQRSRWSDERRALYSKVIAECEYVVNEVTFGKSSKAEPSVRSETT